MNDQAIEQEIQAKGKTAPRITPADIEAAIARTEYFTAAQGVFGRELENQDCASFPNSHGALNLLTFCVIELKNGFTVTGESACASPENFDAEIGRNVARQNAVSKIWPLLGYELKSKLAADDIEPKTADKIRYLSFPDFVQHGIRAGGNMVNGMPWSFQFMGRAVTHETDKCYLIMEPGSVKSLRFTDDDDLVIHPDGRLSVTPAIPF